MFQAVPTIMVWNAADGKLIRTLRGHSSPVNSVAWSPDGLRFVSGGGDCSIKVWVCAGE